MRKKTLLFSGGSFLMIAAVVFVSCNKNELKPTQASSPSSNNNLAIKKTIGLQDLAAAEESEQLAYALNPSLAISAATNNGSCPPIVTYDNPEGVYPRTVVTDWGTGCTYVASGITRSGKVIRTYYGDMKDTTSQSYFIETYDNYYVKSTKQGYDSVKFEGSLRVRHESKTQDPQTAYRQTSLNRKLTEINGDYIIYNGAKRFVKREDDGFYPNIRVQGWFKVTGVETGDVLSGGVSYQFRDSIDVANPIIYKRCDFVVAGNRIINFTNQPTWIVDYGTIVRDCDNLADLTIDGVTTTVTLPINLW